MRRLVLVIIVILATGMGCASMKRFAWDLAPASIKKRIIKKQIRKRAQRVADEHGPLTRKLVAGESLTQEETLRVAPCLKYAQKDFQGQPCYGTELPIEEVGALVEQVSDEVFLGCTAATELHTFLTEGGATDEALDLLADLAEFDLLKPTIEDAAEIFLPNETPEKQKQMAGQLDSLIMAELCSTGHLEECEDTRFEGWEAFGNHVRRNLLLTGNASVHDDHFEVQLEQAMGQRFTTGNKLQLLETGAAGRQARRDLKRGLGEGDRYWFSTWGVYPKEETAREWCDDVLRMHRNGVEVRGIVDKGTLERHNGCLRDLQAAGVPIIEYGFDPQTRRSGWTTHTKWEMRNGVEMVLDSRNIGNHYLHGGPPTDPKWDDYGARVCGPAVRQGEQFFVDTWNDWVDQQGILTKWEWGKLEVGEPKGSCSDTAWDATDVKAAVVGQQSRSKAAELVTGKLKLVRGARAGDTIYLQNAYVIEVPPLTDELLAAAERGAKIVIHTNSTESIDEEGGEIVMPPILGTLQNLLAQAEARGVLGQFDVRLQKGINTVHSKLEVVGDYADFGSDNWHPRGWMYEREVNLFVHDTRVADRIRQNVRRDLANTTPAPSADDIEFEETPLGRMAKVLWNQL